MTGKVLLALPSRPFLQLLKMEQGHNEKKREKKINLVLPYKLCELACWGGKMDLVSYVTEARGKQDK